MAEQICSHTGEEIVITAAGTILIECVLATPVIAIVVYFCCRRK